jgi:hypothetical protein
VENGYNGKNIRFALKIEGFSPIYRCGKDALTRAARDFAAIAVITIDHRRAIDHRSTRLRRGCAARRRPEPAVGGQ